MKILKWVFVVLVITGIVVFFGVPYLLGTDWAKDRVRTSLAEETGREVSIGDIAFSWFDGLKVKDVVVNQKAGDEAVHGPLFRLDTLALDVSLRDVLSRRIDVERFEVEKPLIVIIRDAEGRLNISDLLEEEPAAPAPPPDEPGPGPGTPPGEERKSPDVFAKLDLLRGRLLYVDVPLGTRIEMKDLNSTAEWRNGKLDLVADFLLNEGRSRFAATADLSRRPAPYTVREFTVDGAHLGAELEPLGMFIPLFANPEQASGTLRFSLADVSGEGFDFAAIQQTLSGSGKVSVEGGTILSGPITDLYGILANFRNLGVADLEKLAEGGGEGKALELKLLSSTFRIQSGRIHSDDFSVEGKDLDLLLSGSTGLDGSLDYAVVSETLNRLVKQNRQLAAALGEKGIPLHLGGSLTSPKLQAQGSVKSLIEQGLKGLVEKEVGGRVEEEIGRRIGDLLPGGKKEEEEKKKKDGDRKKRQPVPEED